MPSEGRGKIHNVKRYRKNFKLIDESYNANPLSVRNAIKNYENEALNIKGDYLQDWISFIRTKASKL